MLRRHEAPRMRYAMEIWSAHVLRYSRRDQLSSSMAFHMAGLEPQLLLWDNYSSPYHSWPHFNGRQENARCFPEPETYPAKMAELEARLVSMWQGRLAAEAEVAALLAAQAEARTAREAELNRPLSAHARDLLKLMGQRLTLRTPG
jgi:hypothetical protein